MFNADKTLVYLHDYFDKEFNHLGADSCLLTAIATAVMKSVGLTQTEFIRSLHLKSLLKNITRLDSIVSAIESTTFRRRDGSSVMVKVGVRAMNKPADVVSSLKRLEPVVMTYEAGGPMLDYLIRVEDDPKLNGVMPVNARNIPKSYDLFKVMSNGFGSIAHAVLIVGYDVAHDHLICRDSTSRWGFNRTGFFKVSPVVVGTLTHCIGVVVTENKQRG